MSLKDRILYMSKNQKIIAIGIIVAIIILVVALILGLNSREEVVEPDVTPIDNSGLIVIDEPTVNPEDAVVEDLNPVVHDTDVVTSYIGSITEVEQVASLNKYKLKIAAGEDSRTVEVYADSNVTYFNLQQKVVVIPNTVTEGMEVVVYGSSDSGNKNISARVICIGNDATYNYGVLSQMTHNDADNTFVAYLGNSNDMVKITSETKLTDGIRNTNVTSIQEILKGSKFLYKANSEYEITDFGNLYTAEEVIVVDFAR